MNDPIREALALLDEVVANTNARARRLTEAKEILRAALAAPAASQAGEDAREAKQRILDAAQWWADQRELGPRPAKEAWAALAMRIDAELAMLTEGGAPQPAAQAAPAVMGASRKSTGDAR